MINATMRENEMLQTKTIYNSALFDSLAKGCTGKSAQIFPLILIKFGDLVGIALIEMYLTFMSIFLHEVYVFGI